MRKIYLVRHGQTNANKDKKYCGQTDVSLNENGVNGAKKIAKVLKDVSINQIITSDLNRALTTASYINEYHHLDIIQNKQLREINFGDFENLTFQEISEKYPQAKAEMLDKKTEYVFPNGESISQVYQRVVKGYHDILSSYPDQDILIVAHGGVIRSILTSVLSGDIENYWAIEIDNTTISTIIEDQNYAYLKNLNRIVL